MNKLSLIILSLLNVSMAATEITIRTGGDYTSLSSAWTSFANKDLVTASIDTLKFKIDTTMTQSNLDLSGYTTDSAHIVLIYVASGKTYTVAYSNNDHAVRVNIKNIIIDGLSVNFTQASKSDNSAMVVLYDAAGTKIIVKNCRIKGFLSGTTNNCKGISSNYMTGPDSLFLINNVITGFSNGNTCCGIRCGDGTRMVAYGNTVGNCYTGILSVGTTVGKNNYSAVISGGTAYNNVTMTTCASSDSTGSVGLRNILYNTTNFTDTTSGGEDLSLQTGSALIDVGTDITSSTRAITTDILGVSRGALWDIGAYEHQCTPATITRHTSIIDTIGNSGKFGHVVANAFDSVKFASTTIDSVAMVAYTTKDTIAYKAKKKCAMTALIDTIYSCAGSNKNTCVDSISFIGWSGSYASSPKICTVSVRDTQTISSTVMADSFTFVNMPTGGTGDKTTGSIYWNPTARVVKTGIKTIGWRKGIKADSTYDTITIKYGNVRIDSIVPNSGHAGDTAQVYGRGFGLVTGTGTMNDSTLSMFTWSNTSFKIKIPAIDTGFYDLSLTAIDTVFSDTSRDTLLNAYHVLHPCVFAIKSITPSSKIRARDTITIHTNCGLGTSGLSISVGDSTATIVSGYKDTLAKFIAPGYLTGIKKVTATNTGSDTCSATLNYTKGKKGLKLYKIIY